MIRRLLCALLILTLAAGFYPARAQAFTLSLLSFSTSIEKEAGQIPMADSDAPAATDSATVADMAIVHEYFSPETTVSETTNVLPLPISVVKGVSTYFSAWHPGIDIRADQGSPIGAIREGIVVENDYQLGGYGRYVVIEHTVNGQTLRTLYAHMKAATVEVGDLVQAKETIGFVGLTGHTTGPHVHFETRVCDISEEFYLCRPIDPIRFLTKGLPNPIAKK